MEGNDVEEWLEDMFAEVGEMWSDLCQAETVNYVESRVQTIGTDVKGFCPEFIREVFSSSPVQTQTKTDLVDDIPQTVKHINSTEGVSNEIPSVEMIAKNFEESISVKEEMSGSVDKPYVIVPASLDYSSCQSTLTEYLGDDDLVLPVCQPETSTCDLEDAKISTSFSATDFENKKCIDTTNHFVPGDCENEECFDALNSHAWGTGHPVLKELPISNIPDAASSSELVDVSGTYLVYTNSVSCSIKVLNIVSVSPAGNSVLSEWDYVGSGSSEEVIEHETMLGESCIMVYSNDPCPDKHQLMKHRADAKKLQRKPGLRLAVIKDRDSVLEPKADESSGDGGHSTWQLEMLPSAPEFELIEQDWEIV